MARDALSKIVMGFAFVEMNNQQVFTKLLTFFSKISLFFVSKDAGYLLQCFQSGFEIDNKQILISYSKYNIKSAYV